jgi:CRISPR-associated protein Cas5d
MVMKRYCLEVAGDYACFTRPEMKVERVSYDVITPSAARGILEAIHWKPAICWVVDRADLDLAIYADDSDERAQRAGLFLRDVAYRVHADLEVRDDRRDPEPPAKFFAMFERRADTGQCVNQPYLGCREFAARFRLVADQARERSPIAETRDLGWMLHDLDFSNVNDPQPVFFRARMNAGVVEVDAAAGSAR